MYGIIIIESYKNFKDSKKISTHVADYVQYFTIVCMLFSTDNLQYVYVIILSGTLAMGPFRRNSKEKKFLIIKNDKVPYI